MFLELAKLHIFTKFLFISTLTQQFNRPTLMPQFLGQLALGQVPVFLQNKIHPRTCAFLQFCLATCLNIDEFPLCAARGEGVNVLHTCYRGAVSRLTNAVAGVAEVRFHKICNIVPVALPFGPLWRQKIFRN